MTAMSSLERVMAVLDHRIPDRVPVHLHSFLPAVRHAGLPMGRTLQDGELMAESQLRYWRDFGHDVLLVENGVVAEAQACGCEAIYPDDQPADIVAHVLAGGLERVHDLQVPDPATAQPMCEVLKAVRILRAEIGDRAFIMGRADQGPVALFAALRGYEQAIIDLQLDEEPELLRAVLDYCVRVHRRYAEALRDAGAHGTAMGGAGVDFIGARLHRRFCHPTSSEVIRAVGSPAFPYSLHICGDATEILEDMVATGAQMLELDYKTDPRVAKATVAGRCAILGPVNPVTIWGGTPDAVVDESRAAIEVLAPGGGYILGPGCALGIDTPDANVHALVETAQRYGVYRPDGTLRPAH
jgi:uroporphyrinogen decarboxylase